MAGLGSGGGIAYQRLTSKPTDITGVLGQLGAARDKKKEAEKKKKKEAAHFVQPSSSAGHCPAQQQLTQQTSSRFGPADCPAGLGPTPSKKK